VRGRGARLVAALAAATGLVACTAPPPGSPVSPVAVPSPGPALGTNGAAVPALAWSPCHGRFQCATARVPLSYRAPRAATLDLAVARLPATDPAHRIGSLFLNYGGPGTDGVGELVRFADRYPAELRARFDLIGFDPRGIGSSSPVRCPGAQDLTLPGSPLRAGQRDAFYAAAGATGKACAAGSGALLDHLSTANVARDLDLLRQATGDRGLTFLGYSYGTYLGATYANLFPGNVRALTLDGTLDAVANAAGAPGTQRAPVDVRADVAGAQGEELRAFFDECRRAGPKCAFSAGDPAAKFADLVARLSLGPAGGTTLPALLRTVDSALYQSGRWKRLGSTLDTLYRATAPQGAATGAPPLLDPAIPTHSPGFLAVQCVDSDNPQDPGGYDRLATAENRRVPYFGTGAVFGMVQCLGWPAHDEDRYLGPWNRPRANPILIVNNRHDPATPLHNAQATAAELGNATVLIVEGYGHTSLDVPSACASAATTGYLVALRVPAVGATCAPDTVPFP
jgi:pimeloyl-ACP methyl ester carboxylesterase